MPDLTTSSAIDTFMQSASNAAALTNLGAVASGGALGTPSSGVLTNCTSIPAGQLTGTVATARLGTGTASASTYLRGDATWAAVSSFNPAAPGPIGGTTPAAGTFTALAASGNFVYTGSLISLTGGGVSPPSFTYGFYPYSGVGLGVSSQTNSIGFTGSTGQSLVLIKQGLIALPQISTPSSPPSNNAQIYTKDVSGTAEMFVMDEAGNETQISPHNTAAPEIVVDSAFDEIGYTANYYTGIITYTNKQRQIAGRADSQFFETFEEHNLRIGESLEILDWDTVQADHIAKREEEREAWANRKAEWEANPENTDKPFTETEPEVLTAKPMPTWLADQLSGKEAFLANRLQFKKSWSSKAEFWAEFTDTEKAAIITSEDIGVKMLDKELTMWSGVIIATDSRVIAGLDKLVELDIITEARKEEIITI